MTIHHLPLLTKTAQHTLIREIQTLVLPESPPIHTHHEIGSEISLSDDLLWRDGLD